ncbi:MAG TPA: RcnB family protein [Sphingomicrobium sp.]|nr:RcnB family protein [Sphingomicrobium sp.]
MRKSLFFILLATASMPALAAAPDGHGRGFFNGTNAERGERSGGGNNGQRTERAAPSESNQNVQRSERARAPRVEQPRVEQTQQIVRSDQSSGRSNGYSGRRNGSGNRSNDGAQSAPVVSRDSNAGVTNWRSRERYSGGRTSPTIPTTTQQTRSRYSGDRSGTNWRDRSRTSQTTTTTNRLSNWNDRNRNHNGSRWSSNWRNDHRYDWRNYRTRNRSIFHLGRYNDPFGYGYQRFSIGLFLGAGYYGNNYWLNDPYQYRLPPAYGPYRWVRYYDDALLVDIYSGEVVDVIYGFFW